MKQFNGISLRQWYQVLGDKPFLVSDNGTFSYREAAIHISHLANTVDQLVGKQPVIPMFLTNTSEFVLLVLAIMASGRIPCPLQPSKNLAEINHNIQDLCAYIIITNGCLHGHVFDGANYFVPYKQIKNVDTSIGLLPQYEAIDGSAKLICSTSGTTSSPKRVVLILERLLRNSKAHADSIGLNSEDVILSCLPFYHGMTLLTHIFTSITLQATFVVGQNIYPPTIARLIRDYKVTYTSLVPSIADSIIRNYDKSLFIKNNTLKKLSVGSAPATIRQLKNYGAFFEGIKVFFTYGQTEAGPRISTLTVTGSSDDILSSVGYPILGTQIRIKNPDSNGVGELLVKANWQSIGFYGNEKTSAELWENGWLKTGDIAVFSKDGLLRLKGRLKDVIISGGVNISPAEIEMILNNMPEILESIVVSAPDQRYGEVPWAFLVINKPISKTTLLKRLRTKLDQLKVPKKIHYIDNIPKNAIGKPDRQALKKQFNLLNTNT